MAKRRRKSRKPKTLSGHAPLFLGTLGLGVLEVAARSARYESQGSTREEAMRNATADVLDKAARGDSDASDALTEAAETIRASGK